MRGREKYTVYKEKTEKALRAFLPQDEKSPELIREAMAYSLLAGGKRIRPVLGLAAADLLQEKASDERAVLAYVSAVEMIHNYSLIHDDLPAMDNDNLRRGKPTSHVVYGEATAILAGDALLTRAFELLGEACKSNPRSGEAWARLAAYAGTSGMIGGQIIDISSEGKSISLEELVRLQSLKTGALFEAPVSGVCVLLEAPRAAEEALLEFTLHLGRAFQIQDDILDCAGNSADLGKSTGKDEASGKATYVTLLGAEKAREAAAKEEKAAQQSLGSEALKAYDLSFMRYLLELLSEREH